MTEALNHIDRREEPEVFVLQPFWGVAAAWSVDTRLREAGFHEGEDR